MLDTQKAPNQPNQTQLQIMIERGDPLFAQKTRPVVRKSKHVSLVTAKTSSWKKKQITIERRDPLCADNPVGFSSTFNEVDIDFRISGLQHSFLKQAENFRVRELVKKIESHPHRQDLQADLQQNNAYNLVSEKSPEDDPGHGQCRAILSYARQFLKCNAQNAFFAGVKASFTALVGISWEKVSPADIFANDDWMLSQSRTTLSERGDLVVFGTARASTLKIKQIMIERGKPVVGRDASHESGNEQSMLNE